MTPDDLPLNLLREQPFSFSEEDIAWVGQSAAALAGDVESMIAQLFVIGLHGPAGPWAAEIERLRPGGVTRFFSPDGAAEVTLLQTLQQRSKVPLLVSADLEGSRMSFPFGTQVPNPLALAAVDDEEGADGKSCPLGSARAAAGVGQPCLWWSQGCSIGCDFCLTDPRHPENNGSIPTAPITGNPPHADKAGFRKSYCDDPKTGAVLPKRFWTMNLHAVEGAEDSSAALNDEPRVLLTLQGAGAAGVLAAAELPARATRSVHFARSRLPSELSCSNRGDKCFSCATRIEAGRAARSTVGSSANCERAFWEFCNMVIGKALCNSV